MRYARVDLATAPTRNADLGLYSEKKLDVATESEHWEGIMKSGKSTPGKLVVEFIRQPMKFSKSYVVMI